MSHASARRSSLNYSFVAASVAVLLACLVSPAAGPAAGGAAAGSRLNVLLITADDMNGDTPGCFGGKVAGVTPNIDRLASEGLRFERAHVAVAVCQPSRECLMTGRYPHHNGATGFYPVRADVPTLEEQLKTAGYRLGILGKVTHLRPPRKFPWDMQHDANDLGSGRDPALYYRFARQFLDDAKASGEPFFLMANSHDPHRPWAGSAQEDHRGGEGKGGKPAAGRAADGDADPGDRLGSTPYPAPSHTYTASEVSVPGFLPDLPDVRTEMAQYLSSCRRCDDTVGQVLRALKESGLEQSTLVMFLSDNGISMPFAKSNCYFTSTHTPWIVRWPGKTKPASVDAAHFISGIDFMPTVLEAAGLTLPEGMDGRSFLPLLGGGKQEGRDHVFTCYNDTVAAKHYPMRCLQDGHFGYLFNAWSDGKTRYNVEALSGLTFKAMQSAAATQPAIAERVELLLHRIPEELYDLRADPDCLHDLAVDASHAADLRQYRARMMEWMEQTQDPLLAQYRGRVTAP